MKYIITILFLIVSHSVFSQGTKVVKPTGLDSLKMDSVITQQTPSLSVADLQAFVYRRDRDLQDKFTVTQYRSIMEVLEMLRNEIWAKAEGIRKLKQK